MFIFAICYTTDCLLRFTNTYCNNILLKNHVLLLFKIYVYNSRKHEKASLNGLVRNAVKFKNIEKEIEENNEKKIVLYNKLWKLKKKKNENKLNEKSHSINLYKGWVSGTFLLSTSFLLLLLPGMGHVTSFFPKIK